MGDLVKFAATGEVYGQIATGAVFGDSIPVPLIGKIAELLLKRQNDREWEAVLANIKARVEAETLATVD